jgi:hypothetical protein
LLRVLNTVADLAHFLLYERPVHEPGPKHLAAPVRVTPPSKASSRAVPAGLPSFKPPTRMGSSTLILTGNTVVELGGEPAVGRRGRRWLPEAFALSIFRVESIVGSRRQYISMI